MLKSNKYILRNNRDSKINIYKWSTIIKRNITVLKRFADDIILLDEKEEGLKSILNGMDTILSKNKKSGR